ncbi:MAG: MaoC family dehydratase N-terminal domain-containing protein [Desulfuromonadales bacterium]|nr:MaoC family dehydratase N-terminal domain-containing protein [Desulfuromonadales bacterium]
MLDRKNIGRISKPHTVEVEKGRLKFFAKAIGETNPIYTDESAARAAGYRSLPAPPTFSFSLDLEQDDPFGDLTEMGISLGKLLHGEQNFTYHAPICAGDTITLQSKVVDIYDKKGGALEFLVQDYSLKNQDGQLVAEMRRTLVVRN